MWQTVNEEDLNIKYLMNTFDTQKMKSTKKHAISQNNSSYTWNWPWASHDPSADLSLDSDSCVTQNAEESVLIRHECLY